jgi:hypothetical protein
METDAADCDGLMEHLLYAYILKKMYRRMQHKTAV